MDAAPSPPPGPQPAASPAAGLTAWPRSAQLTTAFLIGVVLTLLAVHALGSLFTGSRPTELHHRIDLNQASKEELLQLPGVGDHMADRIVAYRREQPFRRIEDLRNVPGIGPTRMEHLREWVDVTADGTTDPGPPPARPGRVTGTKKDLDASHPVNINEASVDELVKRLPDVGPVKAAAIVAERAKGPYRSADDLRRVKGFGKITIEKLRPYVAVESEVRRVADADEHK